MVGRLGRRLVVAGMLASVAALAIGQARPSRVAIKAAKFTFVPDEVRALRGKPITLVLSAVDFPHGFSLPDFNLRVDLVPGKDVELTFTPDRVGRYHMLCDNFCGEGHDKMSGWFVVRDA